MYLAMHDIGSDYVLELLKYSKDIDKWKRIDEIAQLYGFLGIQINPNKYKNDLRLSLQEIPTSLRKYRLTYHLSGLYKLTTDEEYKKLDDLILKSFEVANDSGIEDVSFHLLD